MEQNLLITITPDENLVLAQVLLNHMLILAELPINNENDAEMHTIRGIVRKLLEGSQKIHIINLN